VVRGRGDLRRLGALEIATVMRVVRESISAPKELIHDAVGAKTHAARRVVHVLRTGVAADLGALDEARVNARAA